MEEAVQITEHKVMIVQMLSDGFNTREIADYLHIKARTVEAHMCQIKAKTHCTTLSHIVGHFLRQGLIQ